MITRLDFKCLRVKQAAANTLKVLNALISNDYDTFVKNVNMTKTERDARDVGLSVKEFFTKIQTYDTFVQKFFASNLAKVASRQGSVQEREQLEACKNVAASNGITLRSLNCNEWRAVRTEGLVVNKKMMKEIGITKNQCLKSFDAIMYGKMNGFISQKICYSNGGHQDNVFAEMRDHAEWWAKHRSGRDDKLILLIDTDLHQKFQELKRSVECNNIHVLDHVSFQEFMI